MIIFARFSLSLFYAFPSTMTIIAQNSNINDKCIGGVLGIQTQDRRKVGIDKSTELWPND